MEVFVSLPFLLRLQCLEMCFDCKAFLLPTIKLREFISFFKKLHFVNDWPVIYETNFLKYWVHFNRLVTTNEKRTLLLALLTTWFLLGTV